MGRGGAIRFVVADLDVEAHRQAVLALTRAYAQDAMGAGEDLSASVQRELVPRLQAHPTTVVVLAFDGDTPVGIANCFLGFSTFRARPLLNVHDVHVVPYYQGRGVGRRLLQAVEDRARELDCCKLTLEVQENNVPARTLYERLGFREASYADDGGPVLFRVKPLD